MKKYIIKFEKLSLNNLAQVGGKNASLGEMYQNLTSKGIQIPDGFAIVAKAFKELLEYNNLFNKIETELKKLDTSQFSNLKEVGKNCRNLILNAQLPEELIKAITNAYHKLSENSKKIDVAVRSSATAEDLPNASFAGQHESYLNISGDEELLSACLKCYASLFTDRAIKYRIDNGFEHMKVLLSIGIQKMVRADKASSGVSFTLDPDSGFKDVILITGAWGLGENIVQGLVNPDEFIVYKPSLNKNKISIIGKKMGSKEKTLIYKDNPNKNESVINIDTPEDKRIEWILSEDEVVQLAKWSNIIEEHYKKPMDIEWAKDGLDGKLYIIQARPETVYGQKKQQLKIKEYKLQDKGKVLTTGRAIGKKIVSGVARILKTPKDAESLKEGEVLVTEITNPDWDPILKKASAIITEKGGRTSHAAIVARELGAIAVVGTNNATATIKDGDVVTISCTEGDTGIVYAGKLKWEETEIDFSSIEKPKTEVMYILANPEQAFHLSQYPNDGVGLMRLEFVINNSIKVHPMALVNFDQLENKKDKAEIEKITSGYSDKESYFIENLSRAVATVAAAFYPKDVIVRMSDFKTNEYANLLGGKQFEPKEENPMLGFRGASRYYSDSYKEGFGLECKAMKRVRDDMGFTNVKLMIPFCRTIEEGIKVIEIMHHYGLKQCENGLEIYVMAEVPSNVILANQFSALFDGFSIGSNDLTQLTLGIDRDSSLISDIFNENDEAAKEMISKMIQAAKLNGRKIGLCGQAPSDFPEYAGFLVENKIDSISFNPDALLSGMKNIVEAEKKLTKSKEEINKLLERSDLGA